MTAEPRQVELDSGPQAHTPHSIEQAQPRTSLAFAIASPWIGIVQPGAAGRWLSDSSWTTFLCVVLSHVMAATLLTLFLLAWHDSVRVESMARVPGRPPVVLVERSIAEVTAAWYSPGQWDVIDRTVLLVPALTVLATLLLAWLTFADHYEGGSVWRSYGGCWRAMWSLAGIVILIPAVMWSLYVLSSHEEARKMAKAEALSSQGDLFEKLILVTHIGGACLVCWMASRAAVGSRRTWPPVVQPPRCEGCGYDLTHRSTGSVCPECGRDVSSSLAPNSARRDSPWEFSTPVFPSFLETSGRVLASPERFYAALTVRGNDRPSLRFRELTLLLICYGSGLWMFICVLLKSGDIEDAVPVACVVAFLCPLFAWLTQRVVAGLVFVWWIIRKSLPDLRWSRKVFAYETAYLWVFCAFNGLIMSSVFAFDMWMSAAFGASFTGSLMGMPPEPAVVLAGNSLLILNWFRRYRQAMLAVRWANF